MKSHEGRGAGAVYGQRRPSEVEDVGDSVGRDTHGKTCAASFPLSIPTVPHSHVTDSISQLRSQNFCARTSSFPAAEQLAGAQSL
ncbi:hypothetical protein EYF80_049613 [Liparis tanakae]|uniref:Uncharacterized protein n=1 Tax=Liparis tanakae TaxID=230148 RepID=A0A4Z2FIW1_9TELE|nr:hypothetical protein EYF80_049613 [Liparis tanakae]